MTLYSKANLVVANVASKDPMDRALNGVLLDADGSTVGGNPSMFLAVGPVDEGRPPAAQFPDVGPRVKPGDVLGSGGGAVVSVEVVQEAMRNLPKDGAKRPALQHAALTRAANPAKVELTTTSVTGRERRVADYPRRERYVDWRAVVRRANSSDAGVIRVAVPLRKMIDLLRAVEAACPDKGREAPVFLEIGRGVVVRAQNYETGQRVVGVMERFRSGGGWLPRDEWERSVFGDDDEGEPRPQKRRLKRRTRSREI